MATERVPMVKLRELIRLKCGAQLTNRQISSALNVSASTVSYYSRAAEHANLSWPLDESLNDVKLIKLLEPHCQQLRKGLESKTMPDWLDVHKTMKQKYMTLQLLHEEYTQQSAGPHFSYSQFCRQYKAWSKSNKVTMHMPHKAGDMCFIDYCGGTVAIHDRQTGAVKQAQIYVSVLGASSYTYSEATWSQKLPDWINSNVNALEFFGGAPSLLVPDNLRSAIKDSCRYDPVANPTYADFANHYHTSILPARPYSPQDKGKVENAVLIVERWLLARLRKHKFYSLAAANNKIKELVFAINNKPFQKKLGSRQSQFIESEQAALKPLPSHRYAVSTFKKAKVQNDYHVCIDKHYYSVPARLIGETVDCRCTSQMVEILHQNQRVASHPKSDFPAEYTTCQEHMPIAHQKQSNWTPKVFLNWAKQAGDAIHNLANEIVIKKSHPQMSYRFHLGLKNLCREYSVVRVNQACLRALAIGTTSYQSLASILQNNLDKQPFLQDVKNTLMPEHNNIRGSSYYSHTKQTGENDVKPSNHK